MTGGENWFWVRESTTSVDSDQIARLATKYAWAHEDIRAARLSLSATSSIAGLSILSPLTQFPGVVGSEPPQELLRELVSVSAQVGDALGQVVKDLDRLATLVADHAEYLAVAALIYATAEGDADSYLGACRTLIALGCQAPRGGFSGWKLPGALPGYVTGMGESSGRDPGATPTIGNVNGLEAQMRISALATSRGGGAVAGVLSNGGVPGSATFGMLHPPASASRMAMALAHAWERLELFSGRADSGVVVAGASGAVWGSLVGEKIERVPLFATMPGLAASVGLAGGGGVGTPMRAGASNPLLRPVNKGVPSAAAPSWGAPNSPVNVAALRATAASSERFRAQALVQAAGMSLASAGWSLGSPGVAINPDKVRTPLAADALLSRVSRSADLGATGEVQILQHRNPGVARSSWSVVIRGTQQWLPGGTNPQDMTSNLQEVAGKTSAQRIGVRLAMEMAGIGKGDAVEFVGHSQGGAVALALAADPEVQGSYNVVSVLTAGAPISPTVPDKASVLALENLADLVPALDGAPAYAQSGQQVVYFDAAALDPGKTGGAHSIETYVEAARRLGVKSGSDPRLQSVVLWEQGRKDGLELGPDTVTQAQYFATARVRGQVDG